MPTAGGCRHVHRYEGVVVKVAAWNHLHGCHVGRHENCKCPIPGVCPKWQWEQVRVGRPRVPRYQERQAVAAVVSRAAGPQRYAPARNGGSGKARQTRPVFARQHAVGSRRVPPAPSGLRRVSVGGHRFSATVRQVFGSDR